MTAGPSVNPAQKEAIVRYWFEKARESLESARDEYRSGRLSFAMNRIYYACFYALTGVFQDRNKTFKKHKGLRSALHRDLVKGGIIDAQWGKFFDEVFESRQRGDYMPIAVFESAQVEESLEEARQFLNEMEKLIVK
ncbi:MAG: HEPN domain-containing protein [Deltaproteobacteria bacterium]|nr:HEPN domain-containing protein [Deltaproteobacteria bacterium]